MREAIRINRERIREGHELVLAWKGPVEDVTYREAENDILALLEKSGLLKVQER